MTPRETVEEWVRRFNAADIGGLTELYHEDAVNHQVTQAPVEGREAIRAMFERKPSLQNLIDLCRVLRHHLSAGLTLHHACRQQAEHGPANIRPLMRRVLERIDVVRVTRRHGNDQVA